MVPCRLPRAPLFGVLAFGMLTNGSSLEAQAVFPDANGAALADVAAFDAHASSSAWLNMEQDRDLFDKNVQRAFELGLRRDGVRVEASAPNYLFCNLAVAHASGLIAYAWQLEYYSFELVGVHQLLWETGGIVTVGRSNFDADAAVEECIDGFANEWLRWNPPDGS